MTDSEFRDKAQYLAQELNQSLPPIVTREEMLLILLEAIVEKINAQE